MNISNKLVELRDKLRIRLKELLNNTKKLGENLRGFKINLKEMGPKLKDIVKKIKNNEKVQRVYKHKYFHHCSIAAILIILMFSFLYSQSSFRINNLNNKAESYYYLTKYDKAINVYKKVFNAKNDPLVAAKIADIYSIKGDVNNSRKYIEKAKEIESDKSDAVNYIVFDEFMNKDYSQAIADGEAALKKFKRDKKLIKTMYAVYMANNEKEKAVSLIKTYEEDLKSAYDVAEYARMLMISGQINAGLSELRKAFDIDKDEYKIYDVLSQASVYNKDDLLEAISKLSKDNKNDAAYKMWLAKIYSLDASTASDAKKILDNLDTKNLGKFEIKLIQAVVYQNTGESQKADEIITSIIKEKGSDYRILHTAGWFYLNKKDYDNAEKYCRQSIAANKDYTDNYSFLMPEILKGQDKENLSEPYFRTALQKEPYNYNIMLNTANYYLDLSNKDKALEYFKIAEVVKPNDAELKYNMAVIYLTQKKDTEGIAMLKSCIKINDANPKYHRTLGTVYFLDGNKKEALKEIRYAYNADENDILTLNNAGCYYVTEDNDVERGLFNLTKAVQGIDKNTDTYTKDTINENYKKVKKLSDDLKKSKVNDKLKVPELVLFY